jgi:hypothetical protein
MPEKEPYMPTIPADEPSWYAWHAGPVLDSNDDLPADALTLPAVLDRRPA